MFLLWLPAAEHLVFACQRYPVLHTGLFRGMRQQLCSESWSVSCRLQCQGLRPVSRLASQQRCQLQPRFLKHPAL